MSFELYSEELENEIKSFIQNYAMHIFGLDEDNKINYYINFDEGINKITIGSKINPDHKNINKEEGYKKMKNFSKRLVKDIKKEYGIEFETNLIYSYNNDKGIIIKIK